MILKQQTLPKINEKTLKLTNNELHLSKFKLIYAKINRTINWGLLIN